MIKYIEFDSIDETGQHIIPINTTRDMTKTASGSYSPELMKVILNMKRQPDRYYIVVNALGSYEYWGCNRNGDAFPESGLSHLSLRTDMGTDNDYGYKTFEYYAKFYMHHVNKDPSRSFGEIVFSHWNAPMHRVELIIAVDPVKAKDVVDAIEMGTPVSVSMGCRVKYDRCCICGNKAKTRAQYCIHLKNHMREVIDKDTAAQWSRELGLNIMPGTQVFAYNDFPKFFDLSKVYIGADRVSYALGKAASEGHTILSVDVAEAYGVTDADFDKIAMPSKRADIDKEVGGALGPTDIDGEASKAESVQVLRKAMDERMQKVIAAEPELPSTLLDSMATSMPLNNIFSTLIGLGIHPRPHEFQRIILVRIGEKPVADALDDEGIVFDADADVDPVHTIDTGSQNFVDGLGKVLIPFLEKRSSFPAFLIPRYAEADKGSPVAAAIEKTKSSLPQSLLGLSAMYAGLKMDAAGMTAADISKMFMNKPWLIPLIGGGILYLIYKKVNEAPTAEMRTLMTPARDYENILQDTNFSGHIKQSALKLPKILDNAGAGIGERGATTLGTAAIGGALAIPLAYGVNAYNNYAYGKGKKTLTSSNIDPRHAAVGGALAAGGGVLAVENLKRIGKNILKAK